jgi:hypothetical protein
VNPDHAEPGETGGQRRLSFRASGLSMELAITGSADARRLTGQLTPRQSAVVDIRHAGGMSTAEADVFGRFSAGEVPPGPISVRCRLGAGRGHSPVVTGWIAV